MGGREQQDQGGRSLSPELSSCRALYRVTSNGVGSLGSWWAGVSATEALLGGDKGCPVSHRSAELAALSPIAPSRPCMHGPWQSDDQIMEIRSNPCLSAVANFFSSNRDAEFAGARPLSRPRPGEGWAWGWVTVEPGCPIRPPRIRKFSQASFGSV